MVVHNICQVDSVDYRDMESMQVVNSIGDNNTSSSFEAVFPNYNGLHKTDFNIGDDVQISAEKDVNPPTTLLFRGTVEDISFEGSGQTQKVRISGRDYSSRLMDVTVRPESYNNQEVSTIVIDIFDKYAGAGLTRSIDVTTTTLNHISFNHTPLFEALKQLAELSGFFFYVDTSRVLQFEKKGTTSSSTTLSNTGANKNILRAQFKDNDTDLYNRVFVYGGKQLVATQETFTANGTGSVFTVGNRPHNTKVTVSGGTTVIKSGTIFELLARPSGVQYAVDFDQKQIIFLSGTATGDNLPANNELITVDYEKSVPVAKFGESRSSIDSYGLREKIINDNTIIDPQQAAELVKSTLNLHKDPFKEGLITLQSIVSLTPGQTVIVNLPDFNITNVQYDILEANYIFNPWNNRYDEVLTVKVNKKIKDLTDTLKQIILDIKKLQAAQMGVVDIMTRLEFATGSLSMKVSDWRVRTRSLGSTFILEHSILGKLDINTPQPYLMDSIVEGFVAVRSGAE